jgi:predicted PurR-regulated permease PerM
VALRATAVTGSSLLLGFAGNLGIIFFVAYFVLTGGKPLTERFLGLWTYHPDAHHRAHRAMRESARQIRLYAGVLLVTNTVVGIAVWLAFALADLPDAAGWGVAAAVLHVVPYLGMALLTGLGAAETFLAHESVAAALGMASFVVLLSTLIGTLVTAWLQGRAAKMNSAAVFIGLVFWGALWGIWGLFLGPALVVLMKVVAEHSRSGHRLAKLMQG